jgi:hypothetical protein
MDARSPIGVGDKLCGYDVYCLYLIINALSSFPCRRESRKWRIHTFAKLALMPTEESKAVQ